MDWTTMKRWVEMVPQRSAVRELLKKPQCQPAEVSQSDRRVALGNPTTPLAPEAKPRGEIERTRQRAREWRRRALFRKGARLQSTHRWTDDFASLAMLDEDGMVVSWYARESLQAEQRSPMNQHVSCVYTPQDAAMGVPVSDLSTASIQGECTTSGWRVGVDGKEFWATTTIRSVLLRDGRLQGFSHLMHRKPAPWRSVATAKLSSLKQRLPALVVAPPKNLIERCRGALAMRHLPIACLALAIAAFAPTAIGANAPAVLPDNAIRNLSGSSWECAHGFQRNKEACARIELPANAYLDASGNRWRCDRGFLNADGRCARIELPANAYLDDAYGTGWRCDRGFRESKGACVRVEVPAHAHETDSSYGTGWTCDYGYTLSAGLCKSVQIPPNAFLMRSGEEWRCDRGYSETKGACVAIEMPAHAHLDMRGNDWMCGRGYRKSGTACEAIDIPPNAHLDYSGDQWRCNQGFRAKSGACERE